MPLINDDKWGRRVAPIGPIVAVVGAWLASPPPPCSYSPSSSFARQRLRRYGRT